jgi:hypothetical protein
MYEAHIAVVHRSGSKSRSTPSIPLDETNDSIDESAADRLDDLARRDFVAPVPAETVTKTWWAAARTAARLPGLKPLQGSSAAVSILTFPLPSTVRYWGLSSATGSESSPDSSAGTSQVGSPGLPG